MFKNTKLNPKQIIAGFSVLLLLVVNTAPALAASGKTKTTTSSKTTSSSSSNSVTSNTQTQGGASTIQGYATATPLQDGLIVQLTSKGSTSVEASTKTYINQMYGMTVDPDVLAFTVSNASLQNEVYVATSGTYDLIVSNEDGPVTVGEYVTISSVNGVAMGAGTTKETVFGRADQAFDGKANVIGTETLKTTGKSVNLGLIPVSIRIGSNPNIISTKVNLPKPFVKVGLAFAEQPVSPIRTYLSIAIAITTVLVSVTVLYAGVRNTIISIGRNPLSKGHAYRALATVIMTSVIVLMIGFLAVYLLLKI